MGSFLALVIGTLVVGGLLFLGGSLLLGRGETQPPAELDRSPVELPDDRPVTSGDIRGLRISVALRGYRMTEVDWLLDQFAQALDQRDEEIARLEARLQAAERPGPSARPPADQGTAGPEGGTGQEGAAGPADPDGTADPDDAPGLDGPAAGSDGPPGEQEADDAARECPPTRP